MIGIPTPEIMRTEEALRVWGSEAFGYDEKFVPLERQYADYYRKYGESPQEKGSISLAKICLP